jgi:rubrerythrin
VIEQGRATDGRVGVFDYVPFHAAGEAAGGEYRCAECGYGVTVWTKLPRCPMCSGVSWEQSGWGGLDLEAR